MADFTNTSEFRNVAAWPDFIRASTEEEAMDSALAAQHIAFLVELRYNPRKWVVDPSTRA